MNDQESLPTGELEEVLQEEPATLPLPPVEVVPIGVVPVHITGSKHGTSRNVKVNSVDGGVKLLSANQKRRIATLLSDQQFFYNVSQSGLVTGSAALWNANLPLPLTHQEEVWVHLPIDGVISVITEDWAD